MRSRRLPSYKPSPTHVSPLKADLGKSGLPWKYKAGQIGKGFVH